MAFPKVGEVIAGKLRIQREIAKGGMGVVMAAHHLQLDQLVAVKFLLPEMISEPDVLRRFTREARAAARIKSEHVVRVFDVGTLPAHTNAKGVLEDEIPYLVMEYLEGRDLSDVMKSGPIPVWQAADYVLQASEAIAEAHAGGIIHRDLKPGNLFLAKRADGSALIKVLDFGISKMGSGGTLNGVKTQASSILGSPFYMSPEQLEGSMNADARSDIWSLGVILYELTSGRLPFEGDTIAVLAVKVLMEQEIPLRALRPDIPAEFADVVARCLVKDPARRFQHVGELAIALSRFASGAQQNSAQRIHSVATRMPSSPALIDSAPSVPTALESAPSAPHFSTPRGRLESGTLFAPPRPEALAGGVVSTIPGHKGPNRTMWIVGFALFAALAGIGLLYIGIHRMRPHVENVEHVETAPTLVAVATTPPSPSSSDPNLVSPVRESGDPISVTPLATPSASAPTRARSHSRTALNPPSPSASVTASASPSASPSTSASSQPPPRPVNSFGNGLY